MESCINKQSYSLLSKMFLPAVLDSLFNRGHSKYLNEIFESSGLSRVVRKYWTTANLFDYVYELLLDNYRSEYVYKNELAKKLLLRRHSYKNAYMLTEFRVGTNKADVVIVNGTSTVYEIKSEYDNFGRLLNQISSYRSVFDHINVVTSESQIKSAKEILPEKVGILVLSKSNCIKTIRASGSNIKDVDPSKIFDCMRKDEYLSMLIKDYGYLSDVPNTQIYLEAKKVFSRMSPENAHAEFMDVLRNRSRIADSREFIDSVPSSLKAYALCSDIENNKAELCYNAFRGAVISNHHFCLN